jgi:transposase
MAEPFRFNGKILAVAISRKADQRHAPISAETDISGVIKAYRFPESKNQAAGVDLGVKAFAALSDGTAMPGSKAARQYADRLARARNRCLGKPDQKKGRKNQAIAESSRSGWQKFISGQRAPGTAHCTS